MPREDLAEGVALDVHPEGGEVFEEGDEQVLVEAVVGFGEDVAEVLVLGLDGLHGVVDGLADVGAFGEVEEVGETGARGDVEDALGLVVGLADAAASGGLGGQGLLGLGELVAGVAEEDEAEDGDGVLGGLQLGVGPELVGGVPEALL